MRTLCLDAAMDLDADTFGFRSEVSLYDYDVTFWDPAKSIASYLSFATTYMDRPALSESESARLLRDISRRRAEFTEFLALGRTLVVFVPGATDVYADTGERQHSGTGRNRQTTRLVDVVDILGALPVSLARVHAYGTEIECIDGALSSVYRRTQDCWQYRSVLSAVDGWQPLLRVRGTDKIVGAIISAGDRGGRLILLPEFQEYDEEMAHTDHVGETGEISASQLSPEDVSNSPIPAGAEVDSDESEPTAAEEVMAWVSDISSGPDGALPEWTRHFPFPSQESRADRITALESELTTLVDALEALRREEAEDEHWKLLIAGTGEPLRRCVEEALALLGFEILEAPAGRTDVRVSADGRRAVVEVKGVSKTSAEKHAAQLEKWVSKELVEGSQAKGILVVNTWRETPLSERIPPDFPDQMLPYAEGRGHCLVTGVQILCMVRTCLANPSRQSQAREALMSTVGVLSGWDDYRGLAT